jgi:hypothetical protein
MHFCFFPINLAFTQVKNIKKISPIQRLFDICGVGKEPTLEAMIPIGNTC